VGWALIDAASLTFMKEVDDIVMSVPGYVDFCQLQYSDASSANASSAGCVQRVSPVLHFFPSNVTAADGSVTLNPDGKGPLVADIDAVVGN